MAFWLHAMEGWSKRTGSSVSSCVPHLKRPVQAWIANGKGRVTPISYL